MTPGAGCSSRRGSWSTCCTPGTRTRCRSDTRSAAQKISLQEKKFQVVIRLDYLVMHAQSSERNLSLNLIKFLNNNKYC